LCRSGDHTIEKLDHESYPNDSYKYLDGELTNVRSDLVIVDTLHHFISLIIIKTVSNDINF